MATKTERYNIERIQEALGLIKECAREEMAANKELGNGEHVNAWYKAHSKVCMLHGELTDMGFEHFPEFFDEVVISPKGGGGGR